MSLIREVTNLVGKLGSASGDDLAPHLPQFTRKQIFQALQNAKWAGALSIVVPAKGRGRMGGKTPAKYGLATATPVKRVKRVRVVAPRPVCSVWEMGDRAGSRVGGECVERKRPMLNGGQSLQVRGV